MATLTEYFRATGRLRPTHGYRPSVDGTEVTTVGGNEPGGVRLHTFRPADDPGLQGYGAPPP